MTSGASFSTTPCDGISQTPSSLIGSGQPAGCHQHAPELRSLRKSADGSRAAPTNSQTRIHLSAKDRISPHLPYSLESGVPVSCARRGKTISPASQGVDTKRGEFFSWNQAKGREWRRRTLPPPSGSTPNPPYQGGFFPPVMCAHGVGNDERNDNNDIFDKIR